MVTQCCSESRMRSRTSRGVLEWSGGKDLYMGSPVLVTGKVSGAIGNVPGPPGGSRGSTKWGHQPRRLAWEKSGKGPAPEWDGVPPTRPKAQLGGEGGNPRRMGWVKGGAPSHYGMVPLPTLAHGALRDGWPHPVDPRDPSSGPGTLPITPKLSR